MHLYVIKDALAAINSLLTEQVKVEGFGFHVYVDVPLSEGDMEALCSMDSELYQLRSADFKYRYNWERLRTVEKDLASLYSKRQAEAKAAYRS